MEKEKKIEFLAEDFFIFLFFAICSLVLTCWLKITTCNVHYLYLLPITYFLAIVIMRPSLKTIFSSFTCSVFHIIIFGRYLIVPILWASQRNYNGFVVVGADYDSATWLMSYELLALSVFYRFMIKQEARNDSFKEVKISNIIFLFILLWIFIFFTNADYRDSLFTFSVQNREDLGLADGSLKDKIVHDGIYNVFKGVGFLSLFLYIIFCLNKMKNRTIRFCLTLLLCITYTLRTGIGMSSVSRWNMIIGLIVGCIILMNFFQEKSKAIKKGTIFFVVIAIVMGSVLKLFVTQSTEKSIGETMSFYLRAETFDEYFAGIGPVANGLRVNDVKQNEKSVERMFVDCFNTVPFFTKMIGADKIKPTEPLYHDVTWPQLIMPNITMSLFQFGWLLSPIYSILLFWLALFFERKYNTSDDLLVKLITIIIVFWCSLFMILNMNIINSNVVPFVISYGIIQVYKKINGKDDENIDYNPSL